MSCRIGYRPLTIYTCIEWHIGLCVWLVTDRRHVLKRNNVYVLCTVLFASPFPKLSNQTSLRIPRFILLLNGVWFQRGSWLCASNRPGSERLPCSVNCIAYNLDQQECRMKGEKWMEFHTYLPNHNTNDLLTRWGTIPRYPGPIVLWSGRQNRSDALGP